MAEPIKVSKGGVLVPEWGNEGRSDGEKITVHYHFLTFAEQMELTDPSTVGKSMAHEYKNLERMIDKVENLEVQEGSKVRGIKTGSDLVNSGLDQLCMELWLTLRKMSAVDKKKRNSSTALEAEEN